MSDGCPCCLQARWSATRLSQCHRRDDGDRHRPVGAMEAAVDAIRVETDGLSLDQVVEQILALARRRGVTPAVPRQLPEAGAGSTISSAQ
ncbi:MAG: hypothetical protein EBZ13_09785 [Planctomycetia bacterium]|nr:hypothetical protein [Planctomycetia bacterium]